MEREFTDILKVPDVRLGIMIGIRDKESNDKHLILGR